MTNNRSTLAGWLQPQHSAGPAHPPHPPGPPAHPPHPPGLGSAVLAVFHCLHGDKEVVRRESLGKRGESTMIDVDITPTKDHHVAAHSF